MIPCRKLLGAWVGWIALFCLTMSGAVADGQPMVMVGRCEAPRLDGRLSDPCWRDAAVAAPFIRNDGSGPASQQTVVRLCWDERALYLGFQCFERALSPATQQLHLLRQEARLHDGPVFADECIEIFLRPGGRGDYFHLATNMRGTRYDGRGMDASFNASWDVATTADAEAWYVEMAIPFQSLGVPAPRPGDRWTLNFCRTEQILKERSSWSGLQGAFHVPEAFGEVLFSERAVPVQLVDLADLAASASALRLRIGKGDAPMQAELQTKDTTVRRSKAAVPAGMGEVRVAYPVGREGGAGSARYEVTFADGTPVYRSPWFAQMGSVLTLTGHLVLEGGDGTLLRNGQDAVRLPGGKRVPVSLRLEPGENVIALTAPGKTRLSGKLMCGAQEIPVGEGWRWSEAPASGWDQPGFFAEEWRAVASAKGRLALPAAERVHLRRVIAVPVRRERFWPLQQEVNLPRGSRMFLKPLFGCVGEPPADYVYYLDLPAPMRILATDNLDGVPLKPLQSRRIRREGRDYTRYRLEPVGTLAGGFTLELVWSNNAKTSHTYVPAFSLGGTFDWRDFAIEVTSPQYAEQLRVLCLKWQNRGIHGTCWFDDISICEKGTTENLLPQGDFEGDAWKGHVHVAEYTRDGKPNRACRLSGTREEVGRQAGLWVTSDSVPVKPATRYVVRLRAKGERIVSQGGVSRASLVVDVGQPKEEQLVLYSHYESGEGHLVEAEQATPVNLLPAMKGRAPKQVPIIVCYASEAYENQEVVAANAEMVIGAGINWLWGPNESEIARRVRPHGVKFVWHIPRDGYSQEPVDPEYLRRHPEHAAVQRNGVRSTRQICPTVLLDTPNEFVPKLKAWLTQRLRENPYDMVDWDHEFPVVRDQAVCLCERCRKAFAAEAGLPAVPSLEEVFERHEEAWVNFRCGQNARMARVIRDAVKAANPEIPFSVYSGYEAARTRSTYGVDWTKMRDAVDWGIAGYDGGRATIRGTMEALGKVPFTTGCMYAEQRFRAEYPYPTPSSWRIRLMRAVLDCDGMGFLVWYLPVLDGGGYWGISWVSALVADYERFFTRFDRRDDLAMVEPAMDESTFAVLTHGQERLAILMNPGGSPQKVTLALREVPAGSRLVEYETGRQHDPRKPVALELAPGEIKALHLGK